MEATVTRGRLLLGAYGLELGVPLLVAAAGCNRFLTSLKALRSRARPIQMIAGIYWW